MAFRATARSSSLATLPPPSDQKPPEDLTAAALKGVQSMSTCVYQTHIAGYWRNVTVLWSKNLMNYSLTIQIEGDQDCTCKIDLKPWHFWAKKGYKTFEVDGNPVEAYWDLRSAKFSGGGPEPYSDFYVALVSEEELVLLLGDYRKKAYKRTRSRPALVDALFLTKKEHVFGKRSFSTRAKFDQRRNEHDIVVESSTSGPREPEMWISVDGIVVVHIKNLQWKFRGNQTVLVNKQPVQVFWDVHAWLFAEPGTGYGLFIFKPGMAEGDGSEDEEEGRSSGGGDSDDGTGSAQSRYFSTQSVSKASDLCVFLYAWKGE